jgi:hypothetical protein
MDPIMRGELNKYNLHRKESINRRHLRRLGVTFRDDEDNDSDDNSDSNEGDKKDDKKCDVSDLVRVYE